MIRRRNHHLIAIAVGTSNMESADLWKECLHWLRRCGIALPDNIKPTQSLEFFSHYLRDGVLLCHLIHLLNPKALEYFFDVSELICMDPDENEVSYYIIIILVQRMTHLKNLFDINIDRNCVCKISRLFYKYVKPILICNPATCSKPRCCIT